MKKKQEHTIIVQNTRSPHHRNIHVDAIDINNHPTQDDLVVINFYSDRFEVTDFEIYKNGGLHEQRILKSEIADLSGTDATRIRREHESSVFVTKSSVAQLIKELNKFTK